MAAINKRFKNIFQIAPAHPKRFSFTVLKIVALWRNASKS
jgi:hypothetical protein